MIDVRTLLLVTALLSLFVGSILLYVIRNYPMELRAGLGRWGRAMFAHGVGLLLVASHESGAPEWLVLPLGNALLVAGQAYVVHALVRFGRLQTRALWVFGLVPVAWVNGMWFTVVVPDPALRGAVTSACYAIGIVVALRLVWRLLGREPGVGLRLIALTLCAGLVLLSARAALLFAAPVNVDPFAPTLLQVMLPLYLLAACVIGGFAFLLMCYERFTRQALQQASIDPLTDAFNRRALFRIGNGAIADARRNRQRVGVLLVDLDHFKRVNDSHGHDAGDVVLRKLVQRMQDGLRSGDVLGRLGGEEFVALLRDADERTIAEIGERLRAAVQAQPVDIGSASIPITISIGAALLGSGDGDLRALLLRADQALYEAKSGGRNRLVLAGAASDRGPPAASGDVAPARA